ncbi:MAG: DnaA regulatory inactivator Hda [Gammaproteobacteria bacterium]
MDLNTQLALNFELRDEANFDNFFIGSHTELLHALQNTLYGEGEKVIVLCGSHGSGKTHLLQALCNAASHQNLATIYLPLQDLMSEQPEMLEGLEKLSIVCIDDLQYIAGEPAWETAILEFMQKIRQRGHYLIVTAHLPVRDITLFSPKLACALEESAVYQIQALSEPEKTQTLIQRARLRGLYLSLPVAKYLINHGPKDMHSLFATLETLDKASLQAQRRLTIPFIKQVLLDIPVLQAQV